MDRFQLSNMLLIYQHVLSVWHVLSVFTIMTGNKYFNTVYSGCTIIIITPIWFKSNCCCAIFSLRFLLRPNNIDFVFPDFQPTCTQNLTFYCTPEKKDQIFFCVFFCPPPFRRKAEGHCFRLSVVRGTWFRIFSRYLVPSTPPTVFGQSFWNFTGAFAMVWRFACGFFRILKLFFITFFAFLT